MLAKVLIRTIEEGKSDEPGAIKKDLDSTKLARLILQQMRTLVMMAIQGPIFDWEEWWKTWLELVCGGICN
jgi:hypothetical protein